MADYTNPASAISYTDLDFNQIFPELLDTTKTLTSKWDPSTSNESDPGVVLLKEMALVADKVNYRSDTNMLETYPISVTQDVNARELFKQLGYNMKWYRSALTKASIRWTGGITSGVSYTIPAFTMLTDDEGSSIYSILGYASSQSDTTINISDVTLNESTNTPLLVHAIQGISVEYESNSSTTITADMLDSNNRLYFDSSLVAENGVFIENVGRSNWSSWEKVDNLDLYSLGNRYYEFCVSRSSNSCYLQFPDDIAQLIEDGLHIVYILTSGEDGKISARTLTQFRSDLTVTGQDSQSVILSSDNVKITNPSKSTGGYEKESIKEAYKNYKRTVGTFNTLVTLRDYNNYVRRSGLVNNAFVTDRTIDPQLVYSVTHTESGITSSVPYVEIDKITGEKTINPYSLKLYLLRFDDNITSALAFDYTFMLASEADVKIMEAYLEEAKCIPHTFVDLATEDHENKRMHMCFFKNVYPLDIRISPQYDLTSTQLSEVMSDIIQCLMDTLNSSQLEFGDSINETELEETLEQCNSKIKTVRIMNIDYKTYAVIKNTSGGYDELLVSDFVDYSTNSITTEPADWDEEYSSYYKDLNGNHVESVAPAFVASSFYEYDITDKTNPYKPLTTQPTDWTTNYFSYYEEYPVGSGEYRFVREVAPTFSNCYYSLNQQAREEIYAKSVLAGKTQHYIKDEEFDYNLGQIMDNKYESVSQIETSTSISLVGGITNQVRDNETIYLIVPSYRAVDNDTFIDNVRIEWKLTNGKLLTADKTISLENGDIIAFYYKEASNENYKYKIFGEGFNFKPSFSSTLSDNYLTATAMYSKYPFPSSTVQYNFGSTNTSDSDIIDAVTDSKNLLTSTKNVQRLVPDTIKLNYSDTTTSTDTTGYYYYWITDNIVNNEFVLFEKGTLVDSEGNVTKTLGTNEYFYYTNANKSNYVELGAGTTISINKSPTMDWVCSASLDKVKLYEEGMVALEDLWVTLRTTTDSDAVISCTSNTIYAITENQYVQFDTSKTLTKDWIDLNNVQIYYGDSDIGMTKIEDTANMKGRILLELNTSSTECQTLLTGQEVIITDSSVTPSIERTIKDVSVYSDQEISFDGDGKYDATSYDLAKYQYIYTKIWTFTDGAITEFNSADGVFSISITADSDNTSVYATRPSIEFALPVGEYIIPIQHPQDLKYLRFVLSKTKGTTTTTQILHAINKYTVISDAGVYYMYMNIDEQASNVKYTLYVDWIKDANDDLLTISNIIKYTLNTNAPSGADELMKDLDYYSQYDYSYQVEEAVNIENPLSAVEFLNPYHIYNDFTICKLSFDDSQIKLA